MLKQKLPSRKQCVGITIQVIPLVKSVPTARGDLDRVVKPVGSLYAVDGDFLILAFLSKKGPRASRYTVSYALFL